ncbi:thermonuclease family protein [Massilia glaciei]|uniref:Nuclease n=1 Tax=Massilia glaciei TaxID=1524097 RepID=A0A2U2HM48_9BURK|nr:thermonuclease family protein [Massilia glaciei]PWF48577.1 nuclease [Massilia glaciei]
MKLLLIALALASAPALALDVIGIADGDTLTVLQDGRPARIRLANVDAPEKRQGFGQRAKESLSELCYRKDAVLKVVSTDRYGRAVALVSCAGIDVNRAQVERGLAWVYTKYNQDPALPALQEAAAAQRRGLWSEPNPVPPWKFRRPSH